jgi:ubiquinol-cytochrome c reductase cytochrome c subunit
MDDGDRSRRVPTLRRWAIIACSAGASIAILGGVAVSAQETAVTEPEPVRPRSDVDDGRKLFQRDCVYCHGPSGAGTMRGPDIRDRGAAGVDFMLRTGRMPLGDTDQRIERGAPLYTREEIAAIVDHARTFVDGPDIPDVGVDEDVIARGGELFRMHCAACHQMVGTGGILVGDDRPAPTLVVADATEVGEAIRFGPGTMPRFPEDVLSDDDVDAIATYVQLEIQQTTDRGGIPLGHFGPWTEGAVAWIVGLGALLGISAWIGKRT